jgi:biopolymer transport protein ExbD
MITLSKRASNRKETKELKPQLTSLVDAMTILLVFLIKSISVEDSVVTESTDLSLPSSTSKEAARTINNLKITKEKILSDDRIIAEIPSIISSDSITIPELLVLLKSEKRFEKRSEMMIQSDKETPFDVIKKVMYTCSLAGTTDFTILVLREE